MNYKIVERTHKDPYTYVKLEAKANIAGFTTTLTGIGFTKRNACDAPDKRVGYEVAEARAKEDIRKQRSKIKEYYRG